MSAGIPPLRPYQVDPARHGAHKPDERGYCDAGYVCGRWPCDVVDLIDERDAQAALLAECRDALTLLYKEARLALIEPLAHNEIGYAFCVTEDVLARAALTEQPVAAKKGDA